jgi:hypothetical protein
LTQKTIHLAFALPGSGKTHKFLQAARELINADKKIILVLPTNMLADEIMQRMPSDVNATRIDSTTRNKANVIRMLDAALAPTSGEKFIICQHATFDKCSQDHLKDWIVVVDETPAILDLKHHTFKVSQFEHVKYIECVNGLVRIKGGMRNKILIEIQSYRSSKSNRSTKIASTLSDDVYDIYDALINGYMVLVDENSNSGAACQNDKRTVRIINERGFFTRFEAARETHLLTATIVGGLFDYYRVLNGFTYSKSMFTPPCRSVFPLVRVYPMLLPGVVFSKTLADSESESHANLKNLTVMINRIVNHMGEDKILLFTHSWAHAPYGPSLIPCKYDSRGVDTLKRYNNAFTAIHGNPTPPERRSLESLAQSHGTLLTTLLKAWEVTNKYEVIFQNVFRTSLRCMYRSDGALIDTPTSEVRLFVPDYQTVEYLKNYLPEAILDESLAKSYRLEKTKGRTSHPNREKMVRMIKDGCSNKEIEAETKLSRTIICKERLVLGIPSRVKAIGEVIANRRQSSNV